MAGVSPAVRCLMRWRRRVVFVLVVLVGLFVVVMGAWAVAIGPEAVWRVVTKGTTTVWDHLEYPGRDTAASPSAQAWERGTPIEPVVTLDGVALPIERVLEEHDGLAFVVVHDGRVVYEWYAEGHGPSTPSMLFSTSKSITSLLVGAAIEDGLVDSVDDGVTEYIPELSAGGWDTVTIADALRMDTSSSYVEDDNPFGVHVEFNYTGDLEADILGLTIRELPQSSFVYKSGDNAVLGLILDRVLEPESITGYLQRRLLDPLGAEHPGRWSTDSEDGLERTWCCLALTALDLARFGQLVLDEGRVGGEQLIHADWLNESFEPAYGSAAWPPTYEGSPLSNYGYQWWLVGERAVLALGKDGQYLFVDPARDVVIVRTGTSQGGIGWLDLLIEIAGGLGAA
jgi:CubicO group peptidase (beta-lactamase class C family)